jgi:hypothetical protein
MAIEQKAWRPRPDYPALRIVYLSGDAFEAGVEVHTLEGVDVRVYSAARTVADCFKFRNKIGMDVAREAVREYRRVHPKKLDDVWRFARICRVDRIILPYLEATG